MTEIENKLATWFFSLVGYFNHYSFFTEKLRQQVPKFGGEDEANIKCAFMHLWFHNTFGYFTTPVGMTWFRETTEELYNDYIKQYQPVFKAYEKWIEKKEIKTKYIVYEDGEHPFHKYRLIACISVAVFWVIMFVLQNIYIYLYT